MLLTSKLSAAAFIAFAAMSATAIPASAQPKKCEGALTYQSCGSYLVHVQAQRLRVSTIPLDTSPAYMKYTDPRYNSALGDAGGGGGGGGGGR
jgi:hypothetical protein